MISTPALLVSGHFNGPQTHKPCMETWNMAAETKIMKTYFLFLDSIKTNDTQSICKFDLKLIV